MNKEITPTEREALIKLEKECQLLIGEPFTDSVIAVIHTIAAHTVNYLIACGELKTFDTINIDVNRVDNLITISPVKTITASVKL